MLTASPHIPANLKQKLNASVRPFQREYDKMSMGDAKRLVARHGFKVPILCSFVYHGNGTLKRIDVRENLKHQAPSSRQISGSITIFGSAEQGVDDLISPCLQWLSEEAAKAFIAENRHQAMKESDACIDKRLRGISEYNHPQSFGFRDVSALASRRVLEHEQETRKIESNHERLARLARPVPKEFYKELELEKKSAFEWRDEKAARGFLPTLFHNRDLCYDEQVVLEYRYYRYRDEFR